MEDGGSHLENSVNWKHFNDKKLCFREYVYELKNNPIYCKLFLFVWQIPLDELKSPTTDKLTNKRRNLKSAYIHKSCLKFPQ